jgi:acetolactate synthase-1/2/3 large subunit
MHFLATLETPRLRGVLCLFEGVATGAADGWYRMAGRPASTLLHLRPGLANGLAKLHNARRAGSGIVNLVGDHPSAHLKYDARLTSDIEGLARPLSHWVRRAGSPSSVAADAAAAVAQARSKPGRIATLILPGDISWGEVGEHRKPQRPTARRPNAPDCDRVKSIARILGSGEPTLLVLGGSATRGRALDLAGRIANHTGCRIGTQFFTARIERGAAACRSSASPTTFPRR